MRKILVVVALAFGVGWLAPGLPHELTAAENTGVITGTVSSSNGPEAGVWVIAETDELDTVFRKIVGHQRRREISAPRAPRRQL